MQKINLLILTVFLSINLTAQEFNTVKLDSLFTLLEKHNKAMGNIALAVNGKEIYSRAFGYMLIEEEVPADIETRYRIGSISKTFTAVIVMQLLEEGKLELQTKLADFYPDMPKAEDITIEHLLRHRSGLFNFTSAPDYPSWMTEPKTREDLLEKFIKHGVVSKPGTKTEYSNTNYLLLSFIVEDIENKIYPQILNERIINPLKLKNTVYGSTIKPSNNEAKSYKWLGEWQQATETHMSVPVGAGAIVSNPTDLNAFFYALFSGKLVSDESLEKMKQMQDGLGLGLIAFPFHDRVAYGHNGGIDGFQSNAAFFPGDSLAVSITVNAINYPINDILIGILSIYFDRDYNLPVFEAAYQVSAEDLKPYLGVYSSEDFPLKITISQNENTLIGQATGQPSFPLDPVDKHLFKFDPAKLEIEFKPENDMLILRQAGFEYELKK